MKNKWKHLKNALLGNLLLFSVTWYGLANYVILMHDQTGSAFVISFFIYGIKSIDDAKINELKERVEELEQKDKYKLL